jgi:purine-binding chemotaxis protein CheW
MINYFLSVSRYFSYFSSAKNRLCFFHSDHYKIVSKGIGENMSVFDKKEDFVNNTKRFLEFKLGEESYAVELFSVKEVITPPEMTPIPKSPAYFCGLMNLRGLVLTVIDLRKRLSINPLKDTSQNGVIILDLGDKLIGVMVDSIQKVLNISKDNIKPVPDADSPSNAYFVGVIQQDGKISMWLDPKLLLDGTEYKKTA